MVWLKLDEGPPSLFVPLSSRKHGRGPGAGEGSGVEVFFCRFLELCLPNAQERNGTGHRYWARYLSFADCTGWAEYVITLVVVCPFASACTSPEKYPNMDDGGRTLEQMLAMGDCALLFPDGRRLGVDAGLLGLASVVLQEMLSYFVSRKRQRDGEEPQFDIPVGIITVCTSTQRWAHSAVANNKTNTHFVIQQTLRPSVLRHAGGGALPGLGGGA